MKAEKLSEDDFIISIPKEVVEELDIHENDEAKFKVEGKGISIQLDKHKQTNVILLQWFMLPALLCSFLFFMFFWIKDQKQIPFTGDLSIATGVATLGIFTSMVLFVYFFIKERKRQNNSSIGYISWRNFPTIVISFIIIEMLALLIFFKIMNQLFLGVTFDIYTSTALFFIFVSIMNYILIEMSFSITPKLLTNVLIFVIIGGVLTAMMTNSELGWWQYNFSFLGGVEANNSWEFNLTLIFSGLLMIALVDYLFEIIKKNIGQDRRLLILRILLVITAMCLAGIGLFPYNDNPLYQQIHNRVAGLSVVFILILMAGLKWFLPKISKEFLKMTYLIIASLLVIVYLFLGIQYLSLTAFELFAFLLAFSWLLILIKNIQLIAYNTGKSYTVNFVENKKEK